MRRLIIFIIFLFIFSIPTFAENNFDEIYEEQFKTSGAEKLQEEMPKETEKLMNILGVKNIDYNKILKVTPDKFFTLIFSILKDTFPNIMKSICSIFAIILILALVENFSFSNFQKPLNEIARVISIICICIISVQPILKCISNAANTINNSANFMLCYIPVMSGVMIASGQPVTASSYSVIMLSVGEIISQISSKFLLPILNSFLALSIISSISPRLDLSGICNMFNSIVKWTLGIAMTIFTGFLTIQSSLGIAVDNTSSKTLRFLMNSFIPIVGGALGEAFSTVRSCVKLLKSGIGAFGILVAILTFLPIILECIIWTLSINVCSSFSEIFGMKKISILFKNTNKVITTMLSIILCCMMIIIISTIIIINLNSSA